MGNMNSSITQLVVAKDICLTMLKHGCTDGSNLAVMQQIQQVLIYLDDINDNYEVVRKIKKL
jgi:hypothetical protein